MAISEQDKKYVCDTNILLDNIEISNEYKTVLLSSTLRELEKHKISRNEELAYKSRKVVRHIKNNKENFAFDVKEYDGSELGEDFTNEYEDDNILKACLDNDYGLVTGDVLLQIKAVGFDIKVIDPEFTEFSTDVIGYTGVHDLYIDPNDHQDKTLLARLYENSYENELGLVENEYLAIWDETKPAYSDITNKLIGYEALDFFRFNGEKLIKPRYKNTQSLFMGKVKPLNVKQKMVFDLLQNKNIGVAMINGVKGSGKDYTMMAHAVQAIEREEYDKIVFVRNIVPLKNAGETGFLQGDLNTKMKPWTYPIMDALGGEDGLNMLADKGKIEIQHFESIRGRSFTNCLVYCTEIQGMTTEHAKTLLSRMGKGSKLIMNGDYSQIDSDVFKGDNAIHAFKKLKGNQLFGCIELDKVERGDIASLSELI